MTAEGTKRAKRSSGEKREITDALVKAVCHRLSKNLRVRRTLPEKGRLHIDRQLPFLCVYRRPSDRDDAGTERLVKGEASYLVASDSARFRASVAVLVHEVIKTLSREFGAFLIVEIWAEPDGGEANDPAVPTVLPVFTVHAPRSAALADTVDALEKPLKRIKVLKQGVEVKVVRDEKGRPPGMRPLVSAPKARALNCTTIGVAVPPVYRKPKAGGEFPLILRAFRRSIGLALRQAFFEFARSRTTHRPRHYHALGRKAVVTAVWEVDRRLAEVSNSFDYLLQLTPVNSNDAWKQFRRERCDRSPEFHYRPLPVDPGLLKRLLYKVPIERVEDPALQRLFQEKQDELDVKINMLRDRDSARFLYESLQLFGGVEDDLLTLANDLLKHLSQDSQRREPKKERIGAEAFADRANTDIEFYRQSLPDFQATACIRSDVSGLLVSRGRLLIDAQLQVPASRVEALLAHEVGTHLLTYYNGRMQPFQQLYSGLAGYEELQEGLAVLSEFLVGGLSASRMRQLAARVVAVRSMVDGASFVETFRVLDREHAFNQPAAYTTTMRVYRGGGLTKDAVYLRGLRSILHYVQKGGDLAPLFAGKMAIEHIPIIRELQYRNVLVPAPVQPRYMEVRGANERLTELRSGSGSVLDFVNESGRRQ